MSRIVISIYDDLYNPHYGGGGATMVLQIAQRLVIEHDVTVISASYKGSRNVVRSGVKYVFLPVGWAGPRAGQLLFHATLPFLALRGSYDLWIESFTPPFSSSFLPFFARRRPVVGLVQMLSGRQASERYRMPFWRLERRGVRLYRDLIVLNETDLDLLRELNRHATIALLSNGMDVPPRPVTLGQGDHILYLGRIDVNLKGLDLLIEAQARASTLGPVLPLVIAGSGTKSEEQKLRALLTARPGVNALMVGRVGGAVKEDLLRRCACLVMPSRYETFGLSALEAMAHGRAVVVFDLSRLSWIDPLCSVKIAPFDTDALARALLCLSTDSNLRRDMGDRAYTAALLHDWDAVGDRYREFISGVMTRANLERPRLKSNRSFFFWWTRLLRRR